MPRPRTDAFLRGLGRLILGSFYRRIEVIGTDHFPKTGPVIVVANHFNSLVDGAVIITFLPRMPRFLAASTVWDYAPLRPLLNAAGVVPLYRRQDGRSDQGSLSETFGKAIELLQAGGILAVFPEGISHNEPKVLPLKTGTARIALEAEANHGPLGVKIVPVALTFEAKNKFRSRALMEIGCPIEVTRELVEAHSSTMLTVSAAAVRDLTAQVRECLETLTPIHETWEDARLIGRAAEMLQHSEPENWKRRDLAVSTAERRAIQHGYARVRETHPARTVQLRKDLAEYDSMLLFAGLTDAQVAIVPPNRSAAGLIGRALISLALRLPVACVGLVLNWVPYQFLLVLSRRQEMDKRSTWSIFGGLFSFPLFWMFVAVVTGKLVAGPYNASVGWIVGLTVLLAAPVSGKVMLGFFDVVSEIAAWRRLQAAATLSDGLIAKRNLVLNELSALRDAFQAEKSTEPESSLSN